MARPGVAPERIAETIRQLDAEGIEPTVTAIRERLGTGSFSTIGVVLSDWRQGRAKEARPAVPEPSDSVRGLFGQLWAEAWNAALKVHEPERQAFARDRQEYERGKAEMLSEIERLEAELDSEKQATTRAIEELTSERDRTRAELSEVRRALATAEGALGEARKRIAEEEGRNRELAERFLAESSKAQAQVAHSQAEVASLKNDLNAEKERSDKTVAALTAERDRLREELSEVQARIAEAHGSLSEARKQLGLEQERNRELSERVIEATSRASVLAEQLKHEDEEQLK